MTRQKANNPSVFDRLKSDLEDSIAFSKGTLSLTTTELPAPPPKAGLEQGVRISQALTQRVKELAERYETPLPEAAKKVAELEKKVNGHMKRMGVSL
jgi:hypothetical protein